MGNINLYIWQGAKSMGPWIAELSFVSIKARARSDCLQLLYLGDNIALQ